MHRSEYKGLNKFALWLVGEESINNTPPKEDVLSAVLQYWNTQSNGSLIFATIFASTSIALFIEVSPKIIAIPFVLGFIYFACRAWAYGRCASITVKIWK